jgi:hypothetical protein
MLLPATNPIMYSAFVIADSWIYTPVGKKTLHGRVIRRGLWPLHSPDLTSCDSYLWGILKDKLYKTNPHTLEELKNNIHRENSTISKQEHQKVNNVFRSRTHCIPSGRQHFQL